jgi:uncharacterized protein involved in exopolysaccharide biosynthesis
MERTYTMQELSEALRRRRWLALGVAVAVMLVGAAAVVALPSEYRAESVTQIEPHIIPADFFPSSYVSFEERMRTLKHGLLARPVLEKVVQETDFWGDGKRDLDGGVEKLRRNVEVRLEGEVAGGPPSLLFVVEVRGPDRDKVARAAQMIPDEYAKLTRETLQRQATNLRQTLDRQLVDISRQMQDEEAKLVAFKNQHASEVPEANEANMRAATALQAQIDMRLGIIAEAQRRKTAVYTSIPEGYSDVGLAGAGAEDVQRRLEATRAMYGPEHPDVRRLERQYDEIKARNEDGAKRWRKERIDGQLGRIDAEIREQEAAIAGMRTQLVTFQQRLDASPRLGEQYRVLSRQWETLRAKYGSTLSRASDAASAEQLLAADVSTLFRTVQPAHAPSRPFGPNRLNLLLTVLAAALGAALLAVGAAEYLDPSLRGPQDATAFGVPVLASIPRIGPRRVGAQR